MSTKECFEINEITKDIFDCLDERKSEEDIIKYLKSIYSEVNEEEVKKNWEKIKLKTGNKSVLGGVPKSLPALVKAFRIQEKVAGVGFDWENKEDVWTKVEEEISEFQTEVQKKDYSLAEKEFGDVLFSLINYARFLKINPENALEYTNQKFIKRFQYLEELAQEEGKILSEMSLSEMDKLWEKTKNKYK